jgi:hypothetical protein
MPQLTDKTRISHKKLNQIRVTGGYGTYKYYTLKNTFRPLHIFPNMFHTKPTIEKKSLSLFIMEVAIGNLLFYLLISDIVFLCFLFVYPIVDFSIVKFSYEFNLF